MGYRGRLIQPFLADIRRLDTEATAAAKSGAGYDTDFKEPARLPPSSGEGAGASARREKGELLLPCQVEMGSAEKLRQFFSGANPSSDLVLVLHFRDLERSGLVDADGNATLRVGDRLHSIRDSRTKNVVWTPREELYCVEVQPNAFGIGRGRNLLFLFFQYRDNAASG